MAAIDRASISATAESWPAPGFEPSRFGKFRVTWRMHSASWAGVSPAPKQGPQKAVRISAPAWISFSTEPALVSARETGWLAG